MRAAMAAAPVGDDVYGDDPTVNELQRVVRRALRLRERVVLSKRDPKQSRGVDGAIAAGATNTSWARTRTLIGMNRAVPPCSQHSAAPLENDAHGGIALERIAAAIKAGRHAFCAHALLALENTMGGRVLPLQYLREATTFAHAQGLRTHLDGARSSMPSSS